MKILLPFIFFSLWITGLGAQEDSFSSDKNLSISLHKENYLVPYYKSLKRPYETQDDEELKYQLSLKVTLFYFGTSYLAAAYTQKSYWQVYDEDNSRPFRETNYNPEIFSRFGTPYNYFDIGYEHESNGKEEPESRSWDRVFLRGQYSNRFFKIAIKWWSIVEDEDYERIHAERKYPIQDYYGNAELDIGVMALGTIVKALVRYNPITYRGYVESKILWRVSDNLYFGGFYTNGYGDNLRSYNIDNESIGIGFLSNP